jgi:hypothetical protein
LDLLARGSSYFNDIADGADVRQVIYLGAPAEFTETLLLPSLAAVLLSCRFVLPR